MRDIRGGRDALGDALRTVHRGVVNAPLPPDMVTLLGRIDAADAKGKRDVR